MSKIKTIVGQSELLAALEIKFWIEHLNSGKTPIVTSTNKSNVSVKANDRIAFRNFLVRHEMHEILDLKYIVKIGDDNVEKSLDLVQDGEQDIKEFHTSLQKALRSLNKFAINAEKTKHGSELETRSEPVNSSNFDSKNDSFQAADLLDASEHHQQGSFSTSFSSLSSSGKRSKMGPPSLFGKHGNASGISQVGDSLFQIDRVVIERDMATQFYNSPFVHFFDVQRVIMVDETSREVVVCTPMRAAAYHFRRNLVNIPGREQTGDENAYLFDINTVDNIPEQSLIQSFQYVRDRLPSKLDWDNTYQVLEVKEDVGAPSPDNKVWYLSGFPENGGWGKFLHYLIAQKSDFVAVVGGHITNPSHPRVQKLKDGDEDAFDLVFDDQDAELLMAQPRMFKNHVGLQFRGGYALIENHGANCDMLVVPPSGSYGFYHMSDNRSLSKSKTWRLRVQDVIHDIPD